MAKTESDADVDLDYPSYLTKPGTPLQMRFGPWIKDKTGYDPSAAKTKDAAFLEGVRLATALRMPFQASPENKAATAEARVAKASEGEEAAQLRAEAKAARLAAKAEKAASKAPAAVEETDEPVVKPAKGKKGAAAPAPAPAVTPAAVKPAKKAAKGKVAPF